MNYREANDFDTAVEVPNSVWENEKEWEKTHPIQGKRVIRQMGENLDPPAQTVLNIKVVYNSGWVSHFNSESEAAAGAQAVVLEAQAIYQEKYTPISNRLNSNISFTVDEGGRKI